MRDELRIRPSWPPCPIDPAPAPVAVLRAAAVVLIGASVLLILGAFRMGNDGEPTTFAATLLGLWFVSLPVGATLLIAHRLIGARRLRRYERRAGFLPRDGRKQLPATGRTTLYRLEYGTRGGDICLMIAVWQYIDGHGWDRSEPSEWVWVDASDAVELGAQRARLSHMAEQHEERADDERLADLTRRELVDLDVAERRARRLRATGLVEELAQDPR